MSLSTIIPLIPNDKIGEYEKLRRSILEDSFFNLHLRLSQELRSQRGLWTAHVIITTMEETADQPDCRNFEEFSYLCTAMPEVAVVMRRRLDVFLEGVPIDGLIEWYEKVSRCTSVYAWLVQQLYQEITVRIQAVKCVNDEPWFETLATKVLSLGSNYLPNLAPVVTIHCLRLVSAARDVAVKQLH